MFYRTSLCWRVYDLAIFGAYSKQFLDNFLFEFRRWYPIGKWGIVMLNIRDFFLKFTQNQTCKTVQQNRKSSSYVQLFILKYIEKVTCLFHFIHRFASFLWNIYFVDLSPDDFISVWKCHQTWTSKWNLVYIILNSIYCWLSHQIRF